MPRPKKAAGTAVDKRNGRRAELEAVPGGRFDPPDHESWVDEAKAQWDAYWEDVALSAVGRPVDNVLLLRWIRNVDRYTRLIEAADACPMVEGSTGQSRSNPLYDVALKVEASIRADEKQLGVGPKNRADLGIAVVQERKSLSELNAAVRGSSGGRSDAPRLATARDPRVIEA